MKRESPATEPGPRRSPVFIHSLWRSGSTYLFNVFRRSPEGYWCYQEPVHETALFYKDAPQAMLSIEIGEHRHPRLDKPYFEELAEVADAWKGIIAKPIIYDEYFDTACGADMRGYIQAIISAAKGRAVIQECRTSNRIRSLKEAFGGIHVYLWRNPWDQWWSFKVNEYFDAAIQMAVNAPVHPPAIARLRQEIGFAEFHHEDIRREFAHFKARRLTAEDNYLSFYILWLLALHEGMSCADCLLNIDMLSDSAEYRQSLLDELEAAGLTGLDFADCRVFQSGFSGKEAEFFRRIEECAHALLLASGYTHEQIEALQAVRASHFPRQAAGASQEEAARAREVVLRLETEHHGILWSVKERLQVEHNAKLRLIEERAAAEQETSAELRQRLQAAQQQAEETKAEFERVLGEQEQALSSAQQELDETQRVLGEAQQALQVTHAALTWRMTAPLRTLGFCFSGWTAARAYRHVMAYDGEKFIAAAYAEILGRDPDPGGMEHFLSLLRAGRSKKKIITHLRRSPEGRSRAAQKSEQAKSIFQRVVINRWNGHPSPDDLAPLARHIYFQLSAALKERGMTASSTSTRENI